jgi:hypothetical protein
MSVADREPLVFVEPRVAWESPGTRARADGLARLRRQRAGWRPDGGHRMPASEQPAPNSPRAQPPGLRRFEFKKGGRNLAAGLPDGAGEFGRTDDLCPRLGSRPYNGASCGPSRNCTLGSRHPRAGTGAQADLALLPVREWLAVRAERIEQPARTVPTGRLGAHFFARSLIHATALGRRARSYHRGGRAGSTRHRRCFAAVSLGRA